jgi:hypothetical protein
MDLKIACTLILKVPNGLVNTGEGEKDERTLPYG